VLQSEMRDPKIFDEAVIFDIIVDKLLVRIGKEKQFDANIV